MTFVVPERLFNLLNKNSPDDFLKGVRLRASFQLGLDWICGFNIPIITLCAFIVLFIFLGVAQPDFLVVAIHQDLHSVSEETVKSYDKSNPSSRAHWLATVAVPGFPGTAQLLPTLEETCGK